MPQFVHIYIYIYIYIAEKTQKAGFSQIKKRPLALADLCPGNVCEEVNAKLMCGRKGAPIWV